MALPSQVEQQGKAADEALSTINTPPVAETPVTKPVASDADTVESNEAQVQDLKDQLEKAEHKYSVLQGKYNAEIKPLKDDINALNNLKAQVKNLEREIAESKRKVAELVTSNAEFVKKNKDLQSQLASKQPETPATAEAVDVSELLSDDDREALDAFGIDDSDGFMSIISKLIGKLQPSTTAKEPTSKTPEADSNDSEEQNVVDSFWIGLEDAVSDWRPINRSAEFNDWLDEEAPYAGKLKREILREAQDTLNLKTVIQLFNDFKASDKYNPTEQAPEPQDTPPTEEDTTEKEKQLEQEVEPDRSQHVDINLKPQAKTTFDKMLDPKYQFKTSEITAFYKDATQTGGLLQTNPELYAKIDQAIVKADPEGRVIRDS